MYLGIDWGTKRIGLALGDSETKIATPFKIARDIDEIKKIIKDEEVDKIIIGEPLKMQNSELKTQDEFLKFLESLKKEIKIPIIKVDERLSSKGADALVGNKKTKASRDAIAAMLILQSYFDKI